MRWFDDQPLFWSIRGCWLQWAGMDGWGKLKNKIDQIIDDARRKRNGWMGERASERTNERVRDPFKCFTQANIFTGSVLCVCISPGWTYHHHHCGGGGDVGYYNVEQWVQPNQTNTSLAHSPSILLVDIIYNQNTANSQRWNRFKSNWCCCCYHLLVDSINTFQTSRIDKSEVVGNNVQVLWTWVHIQDSMAVSLWEEEEEEKVEDKRIQEDNGATPTTSPSPFYGRTLPRRW